MALQVCVSEDGPDSSIEAKSNGSDDIAVAPGGVEDATAVSEMALIVSKGHKGAYFEIEGADGSDGASDLLPVGSDVLHRGAADGAGDSGEALDAADSLFADVKDKGVPFRSGAGGVVDESAVRNSFNGVVDGDADDQAIEAFVADKQVAASAKNEDFEIVPTGILNGFEKLDFAGNLAEIAGRAADAEGRVGGEGDLLLDADGGSLHGFEGTTPAAWGLARRGARPYNRFRRPF